MKNVNKPDLLLASRSPRRHELLTLLGLPFEVTTATVDETPYPDETPAQLVVRLSQAKASAAEKDEQDHAIIVTCDTIVALNGDVLGKPRDEREATAMLHRLRGRPHTVYSGLTLLESIGDRAVTKLVETQVTMRNYTEDEIATYVASGDPLDKAGAYAIQHDGFHPVSDLQGCYASVMGLPLCHLAHCLRTWEITPPTDLPTICQAHIGQKCLFYRRLGKVACASEAAHHYTKD